MLLSTSNHSRRGRFDRVCDQAYSERCAIFGVCVPEPHLVPDNFRTKLTWEFTFIPIQSHAKIFRVVNVSDVCCQTRQSAFCWHHVFPSEIHILHFMMDLDVNERIYSVFQGLLQDGTGTNLRRNKVGSTLIS
jgi:hypothetical protein